MRMCLPLVLLTMFWLSSTGTAQEEPRHVVNGQGERPQPVVAIDNVCAWPHRMRLRDGTLVATIHNQPSHLQQPADVECWISQDGGAHWTRRGVPAPRDDAGAARGMFAAGAAPNGDLVVLSTGHAKTLASKPDWGPVTPTWISRSSELNARGRRRAMRESSRGRAGRPAHNLGQSVSECGHTLWRTIE
jgi:hypothetical protein